MAHVGQRGRETGMAETDTGNIREILGRLIGKKLIDISQHDQADLETLDSFI